MVRRTVQRTDTSHTKQVQRALTCMIFVLVVIPLFQRGRGVCKQKLSSRCVDFEFWKRGGGDHIRKKKGGERGGGNRVKRKERKTGRRLVFPMDSKTRIDPSISHLQKSFSLHLFAF